MELSLDIDALAFQGDGFRLEALLNTLPPVLPKSKKKPDPNLQGAANDFEALEKLRRLAFAEKVPEPKHSEQIEMELIVGASAEDGGDE